MNWKNILTRAAWTFVQAAASALVAAASFDLSVLEAAGLAGLAAVLSLLKTIATEQLELRRARAAGYPV